MINGFLSILCYLFYYPSNCLSVRPSSPGTGWQREVYLIVGLGELAPLDNDVHGVAPAKGMLCNAAARAFRAHHRPPGCALGRLRQKPEDSLLIPTNGVHDCQRILYNFAHEQKISAPLRQF